MIVILDYGMGNLRSVERAVRHLGYECEIQPTLHGASKVILPGVGAFGAAMDRLHPLRNDLRRFTAEGSPLLGICLGQQLLFERSEELGATEGLGILPGEVRYLPPGEGLKIPHMGWNEVMFAEEAQLGQSFPAGGQVYFVHSLYTACADPRMVAGTTTYGITFPSVIEAKNVWATQFHPEKSGEVGLRILENFLRC